MRKIYLVVAVAAVFLCAVGCNDGGVESGGGDAVAYLYRFYVYETVTIGGQSWTKKNLNIETADSWCYENSADSCEKYGRLYTWEAAKSVCQLVGLKLPTVEDWRILFESVGGGNVACKKLKAKNGWIENGNGTDDFGFSALPGGYYKDGGFIFAGEIGYWWTATKTRGEDNAQHVEMSFSDYENVGGVLTGGGKMGLSVRCVKE